MALQMTIEVSSGVSATEVPDSRAKDLQEAYDALKALPVNRMVTVDFPEDGEDDYAGPAKIDGKPVTDAQKAAWYARRFVKQGKAWAAAQEIVVPIFAEDGKTTIGSRKSALVFARKGDIKGLPSRVSFRIYVPRAGEDDTQPETTENASE
jgi:hypothetical protein